MMLAMKLEAPLAFTNNLKRLRGERSQEEIAKAAGVKQPVYSKWETGKTVPGGKFIPRLARAYGVSASEVVLGLDPKYDRDHAWQTGGVHQSNADRPPSSVSEARLFRELRKNVGHRIGQIERLGHDLIALAESHRRDLEAAEPIEIAPGVDTSSRKTSGRLGG